MLFFAASIAIVFLSGTVAANVQPVEYTARALRDEVQALPGAPPNPGFRQFAGYIDVGNGRELFYTFVESQNEPARDPLLLWTNGGPGCSGLGGFFGEQGPFRCNGDGTLHMNDWAWNKVANMVFIEQPAGVGFSTAGGGKIAYGDAQCANDNYAFVRGFFERFPAYNATDFYLTSESYGGHYLPTLSTTILARGGVPNFRGMAVGNPLTDMASRNYGQFGTWYNHQLIPKPMWDAYLAAGCKTDDPANPSDACTKITNEMAPLVAHLNPYGLDFPICSGSGGGSDAAHMRAMSALLARVQPASATGSYWPSDYDACSDAHTATYLQRRDVRAAMHVSAAAMNRTWSDCNMNVNQNYNAQDTLAPMMPLYEKMLTTTGGGLSLLIYSGDDDSVCATLGSQQWLWDLGTKHGVTSAWAPWATAAGGGGQVGGYHVAFGGAAATLHFATVHGAGHMVPQTRPQQALEVLQKFLAGEW